MTAFARLETTILEPDEELRKFIAASPADGAVVSFVGLARPTDAHHQPIERLLLAHHPRLTQMSLEGIAVDALQRFGVSRTLVVHRCGSVFRESRLSSLLLPRHTGALLSKRRII